MSRFYEDEEGRLPNSPYFWDRLSDSERRYIVGSGHEGGKRMRIAVAGAEGIAYGAGVVRDIFESFKGDGRKRLRSGRNKDPPAKRRIFIDDGDAELKMSAMQIDGRSKMYMSSAVGRGPRRKVVHGRSRKVKARQKLMYRTNLSNASTCLRTDAVMVSAPPNVQTVVVNMLGAHNLQESEVNRTSAQLLALPITEVSVDRDTVNGNNHNSGKVSILRHVVDYTGTTAGQSITNAGAIKAGGSPSIRFQRCAVRPSMAWTLMDNWMWRDMALYCSNKYPNQLALSSGYHPPNDLYPLGGYISSIVLGADPPSVATADNALVTPCAASDFSSSNDLAYQGYNGSPGIGGRGKHLYVHSASIKFEVENLENSGVFVEVYELTMRNSERLLYGGTESATQAGSTAYPVGRFVDPVELWHSKLRRWSNTLGQPLTVGNNQDGTSSEGVEFSTQLTRHNIYHVGQDPSKWVSSEYYVNKKVLRIAEGGKGVISFTVNHQNYIPNSWWDKYYGIKGLTRTYMMVVKGDRALGSTSTLTPLQQVSADANVRVNVVKAFKAGFGLIRQDNNYVERKVRVNSGAITGLLAVSPDGDLDNADEVGGINSVMDQTRIFGTNAGNLMIDNAVPNV